MRTTIRTRLRATALAAVMAITSFAVTAVPGTPGTADPADDPLGAALDTLTAALAPDVARAAWCASVPSFTGYLTPSATSTTAVYRTTSREVWGYISDVDAAWSCTNAFRFSALAWNITASLGRFNWGNLINSTSVACNWVVGSTDYLKANHSTDCADSDAEYAMKIWLDGERQYNNNAAHTAEGHFSWAHTDCGTYYGVSDPNELGERHKTNESFATSNVDNRPGSNCDPIVLDNTGVGQTLIYDATAPTGSSISINSGAAGTANILVTLTLAATDNVAGVADMRFSNNGTSWSSWEAYATTRSGWDIASATYGGSSTNGTKSVYVQFRDANGNGPSTTISDTILYDNTPPTGTITINAGATYTTTQAVNLTLSASDTHSSVSEMRFSNDGTTWPSWEPYVTTRGWTLTGGDGTKTVRVQFRDSLGNANTGTSINDSIILDTTPATPSPPDVTCTGTGVYQAAANGTCFFRPAAASTLTLTASAADATSGIGYLRFQTLSPTTNWTPSPALPNDDTASPYTQGLAFTAATPSATIGVLSRNGAGLDSATRTVTLTTDATSPTATLTAPGANGVLAGPITIVGTATDSQTFKEYELLYGAGASPSGWTNIGTFTSPVSNGTLHTWTPGSLTGAYTIRLTVRDHVGNSSVSDRLVYLDNARRGEEAYWSRVPFEFGGGWSLDVGVANGEARLTREFFRIPSYGPPQALELTYSSLESTTAGRFGTGWVSNLTQYLTYESEFVVWHRADGGLVPFGNVAGTWTPLRGHFETLTRSGSEDTITATDQSKVVFDSTTGRLKRLENRFGDALTLAWSTSSATATDDSGRSTAIAIDSGNNRVTSVTDSAGRTWSFAYTGSDLTSVTDPAGKATTLGYTSGLLTSVSRSRSQAVGSPETLLWTIGYTGGKATSVLDPMGDAASGDPAHTFTYNPTNTLAGLLNEPYWVPWRPR